MGSLSAFAQSISYQGRLSGLPPGGGTGLKSIVVCIYDASAGTNCLWGPKNFSAVPVVDGYFNVVLPEMDNSGTNSIATIGAGPAFVEVVVDGVTNAPRQQILAVPSALNGVPPGAILPFGGQTNRIPAGWLLCDGREVSRTRYGALYQAVSNSWGAGTTTNTFRVPDLRGQFLRGVDLGAGVDTEAGLRSNKWTGVTVGNVAGGYQGDGFRHHSHDAWRGRTQTGSGAYYGFDAYLDPSVKVSTDEAGGSETRPKNAAVNYIIKY